MFTAFLFAFNHIKSLYLLQINSQNQCLEFLQDFLQKQIRN